MRTIDAQFVSCTSTTRCGRLAKSAMQSLIEEANLTPKPGLVDTRGGGSHSDMTVDLLERSAETLEPWFYLMAKAATEQEGLRLRETLGDLGREAEREMLEVTGGVNTHRGAIWSLGLLIAATAAAGPEVHPRELCVLAGQIARLPDSFAPATTETHGGAVREVYGLGGAREEAQAGFPSVRHHGLPALEAARRSGATQRDAQLETLLSLMSVVDDTCIVFRGGLVSLRELQRRARAVVAAGGRKTSAGKQSFHALDRWAREHALSPGGCADLLAATLFLNRLRLEDVR